MIHNENAHEQLRQSFCALTTLKYALENTEVFPDSAPAYLLDEIQDSLNNACDRIEAKHEAELDFLKTLKSSKPNELSLDDLKKMPSLQALHQYEDGSNCPYLRNLLTEHENALISLLSEGPA